MSHEPIGHADCAYAVYVSSRSGRRLRPSLPGTETGYVVKSEPAASETACRLVRQIEKTGLNPHAVLVLRHGTLVFEHYSGGRDQPWGSPAGTYQYGVGDLHDVRSVSKSVVSLLIGIALDRGLIKDLDQSMFE
ncbi:hypothetical protein N7E02_24260 [Aliirhizobium terrae]|uniref:hypothetical protein n=1 Tax=Terrirhizobium terrae TaxID=2926709 RepID=UPI002577D021|nr:hypothetical protein [Rhizobium sp. CC-CFT758]WJH39812.1 hypothetical protein N7E02_24260 [Rhizobium sp. CC-CFT758]